MTQQTGSVTRLTRRGPLALVAVVIVAVNSVAVAGQSAWFAEYVTHGSWRAAIFMGCVVEAIAVYYAGSAHAFLLRGRAALTLRLKSYGWALGCGFLNYWHYAGPHFTPNPAAVTFAALSSISPWLWAIYSKLTNFDRLNELGLIDKRAPKFAIASWLLYPIRTFKAFRLAVWEDIDSAKDAREALDLRRKHRNAPLSPAIPAWTQVDEPGDWPTTEAIWAEHAQPATVAQDVNHEMQRLADGASESVTESPTGSGATVFPLNGRRPMNQSARRRALIQAPIQPKAELTDEQIAGVIRANVMATGDAKANQRGRIKSVEETLGKRIGQSRIIRISILILEGKL